jgi:hypothetical protein
VPTTFDAQPVGAEPEEDGLDPFATNDTIPTR